MKNIWFVALCLLCFFNCESSKSKPSNPLSLVPEDTEVIIKINSQESLANGLKNNALIKASEAYSEIENFQSLLIPLHHINKNNSFITLSHKNTDSLNISYIIPSPKHNIHLDSIPNLKTDSTFNNSNGIRKLSFNNNIFYSKLVDSTFFISNSLELTKTASSKTINPEIEALFSISDQSKMTSVLINHKKGAFTPIIFNDSILNKVQFSNYTLIDTEVSQNSILLNGITKAKDSTKSLINLFKNTIPQENKIASILPNTTEQFSSFTFNDYSIFRNNLTQHKHQDSTSHHLSFFQSIIEIGQTKINNKQAILFRSIDPTLAQDALNANQVEDNFRSINLYSLEDTNTNEFLSAFTPLIKSINAKYYSILDDFFVFTDDLNTLKHIISNHQNNTVLSESDNYVDTQLDLSDEASILLFGNSAELNNILNLNFSDDKTLDITNFNHSIIQFVYDSDFAHVNAVFKTHKAKRSVNSVTEEFNISIDANLISPPQLVKNHTNNQMDIVVQDVNNNLYLISNKGKVFWKKQLDGKILGKIEQIDTYKNGRLQLVFNTSKKLYVLDRNGNNVNAFPLGFNDELTQPVSVFDYDKNKKYRFMIVQGKSVLMYDKNGKKVSGFTYTNAPSIISTQPKHFRINRKDYLVFASGNTMQILDRTGKTRTKVKEKISFSDNDIYLYKNKFTTSNTNGELLEINPSGTVNHSNLNTSSEHKIATTSKTLVVMNENILNIKSKSVELDFGDYTAPKIFYINDKIYVSVTDLQAKKAYLFDSQAKLIANFPVYANSELELGNTDKDSALEIVTKGDNDSIIVYEIQ
ncbi:ribonuclease HII [Psychroserpens sp. MEBiC05023]